MKVAFFKQFLAQADGRVVGVGKKSVLDDNAAASTSLEDFDEVLKKEERGLAGADGKVLLHFLALFAAEGRIGDDDVEAVFLLHVGKIFSKCVGVNNVRRFDAVQDHVHDRDDIRERFLFLPIEGALLQSAILRGGALGILGAEVVE